MRKKILVVVDMQNDFIDGALGTSEAQNIVSKVQEKIKQRRAEGWDIIFTRDTHFHDYLDTFEGHNLPVEHCIKGTKGWEISPAIEVDEKDLIRDKTSFGYPYWAELLEDKYNYEYELEFIIEEIELCGLCTDICVVSNALILRATLPDIEMSVDASCCAGSTPDRHKAALETMKSCHIQVVNE